MGACVCKDRNAESPITQAEERDFNTHCSSHQYQDINGHQNIASFSDQSDRGSGNRHNRHNGYQVCFTCQNYKQ